MESQRIINLYRQTFGAEPSNIEKLPASGSNRQYFRLTAPACCDSVVTPSTGTIIGCIGTNTAENASFYALAEAFAARHLPVPAVYAMSDDQTCYLQQDLGSTSLFDFIRKGREAGGQYDDMERAMLHTVMADLPSLQMEAASEAIYQHCYPQPYFDERTVRFDLNYFKYNYLKLTGIDFNEMELEDEFDRLCHELLSVEEQGFMYRDFQARNVMLYEGRPYYIDFQGGRRGPIYYDVASFLWQASARYPDQLRQELIDTYLSSLQEYVSIDRETFMQRLHLFVLFRTLQVLGAYGFRGLWERKPHFLQSIPAALENLTAILASLSAEPFPYLSHLATKLSRPLPSPLEGSGGPLGFAPLTVRIFSFSYKSPLGIPKDESGNGGGYVFDCRSTNNPGRYAEYKQLTGLDQAVIDFLERDGEILTFLESVYKLADFHVQRYLDRGFTSLMFSFGCTGGQHRSVYSAQHLAEHLHRKFGIHVVVCHREQGKTFELPRTPDPTPDLHQGVGSAPQAFILAAGLGTRLRPLTDTMPKALVPVCGKPLLQHQIERLAAAGFTRIVINIHHFGEQIIDFVEQYKEQNTQFKDLELLISDERQQLLDTGGAIRHAAPLFDPTKPVLVHNVDILHNADLRQLYAQCEGGAEASLLVSQRDTSRYLIFDNEKRLIGWKNIKTGEVKPQGLTPPLPEEAVGGLYLAFSGIHVLSPSLIATMQSWPERFSIIDFYLDACQRSAIRGIEIPDFRMVDVGKLDTLATAEAFMQSTHPTI